MADDIQQKISEALDKGISMSDIAEHLASHPNPDYQSYGKSWLESATAEPTRKSDFQGRPTGQGVQTGLIDWAQANPQEALLYGAGAYAALQAPKIASKVADYRLKQRELGLKERSLAAYESQVAKQGVAPELLNPKDDLINSVRQNEFDQLKTNTQTVQDQIAQERLRQAQLKTQRAEVEHQNWLAKNTLSEAEQAFGRKAKDPNELRLMQAAVQQQAGKGPVAPTTTISAPVAELPVVTSPLANVPPAERWGAPVNASVTTAAPVITPPANVLSTGPTPEAAAAPIKEIEVIKKAVTPTAVKGPVEPTTFRADLGPGDNWLYNTAGPEKRKAILKEFNEGKPAGSYDEAQKLWAKYIENRRQTFEGPEMTKEVRKERGIPPRENFGQLGKVTKVAGVAGLALTAAQMAQAAQKGNYLEAGLRGADLATDYIPGVAQLKQGLTPFSVGEGSTLSPEQIQQRDRNPFLLGSPYAQTEQAKKFREKEEYIRKVGAGRGIAPPSAYMR